MEKPGELKARIKELEARLTEAEETLHAIRSGEVDALVVAGADGDQVFTLKGAEMPYRILIEEMNQGALLIIPDGTIAYANTRFAILSKTPLERVIGSPWKHFFAPDKHSDIEAWFKTTLPGVSLGKLNLQAADGTSCPIHLSLRTMSGSSVAGFSLIVTDLTERQQSENALRKTSAELLERNEALEAFSNIVSHDMRAPLRSMQGFARIMVEDYGDKLDAEGKSCLERIVASANQLERLICDVLAYSQSSCAQNEAGTFDLDKMVREMVKTYPNLREADIEILASTALVRGYEVALGQCISNLLGNALKFVTAGVPAKVKVWTEASNGHLRLWVQDNGIGISPKDQEKIFDAFVRVDSSEVYEGTGLGLSMVKKAVEKMGGSVGVESELGKGSRFWIELERG